MVGSAWRCLWFGGVAVPGDHRNLWRIFADVARAHPDRTAFVDPETTLSYRELATLAAHLANRLTERNVAAGDLVAIQMPVGARFVVGVLAGLAVGAAYLPVDVSGPANRRSRILEHARPSVVLTAADIALDVHADPDRHHPATGADDPAYVIYTSGSTGAPKGVVVPGRGVHNLLAAFQRRAPLAPGARCGWWTSPGFDVSVYELWSALCYGGAVVPVPDTRRRDVDATVDYLIEQRVDSAYLPPQFLPALRDRALRGSAPPLRRLLTGVEPIPIGLLVELRTAIPGLVIINGYGPTEATVCATLYTVPDRCTEPQRRTPIGQVVEGNRDFVLDERMAPVAPGEAGELFVAGQGLALGYWRDPERTGERFVAAVDGDGLMYRTGDLVIADAAGDLTFLGRVDDQLKIDGVRVEPAETEAALRRLPEIADVAVLAWPPDGPAVLTAFVVLTNAMDAPPWHVIRRRLADELPAAAVPRRCYPLDRIPMTDDGKLDRAALPRPDDRRARPARNEREQAVEDACRSVLPSPPGTVLDLGFAELGGDSLRAAQLSIVLRTTTGRAVTAAHVLAAATLADLSAEIATLPVVAAPDERVGDTAPLTASQAGIWAAELTEAAPGAFHESVALRLDGPVEPHRVAAALATVLNRHAVFRGRIDEGTLAFVTDGAPLSVPVRSDDTWPALLAELTRPAFDLGRGPLVRAAVLSAPDDVRVLVVWHHIVVDAWTVRLVLSELTAALAGATGFPVEHGHARYARRQQRYLDSTDGKLAVRAAADRVRAWPPPAEVDARPTGSCRVHELSVGPGVWSDVRDCARSNGTTMFAVTLAAVLDPLCRLAGTHGRFALAVADRDEAADADAAGYFLTTVPFGPHRAADALRHAREVVAEARTLSTVPFPALMAELGLRDTRLVAPLVIAWDRDPATALALPGCVVRSLPVRPLGTRWPWTVVLTDAGERGLTGRIECPPDADHAEVARFVAGVESLLATFVKGRPAIE